jgi:hypothetical protein
VALVLLLSSKKTCQESWWVWPKNCPVIVLSNLHTLYIPDIDILPTLANWGRKKMVMWWDKITE